MEIKTEKEKVKKRLDEIKRQNAPMQKRLDEVTKKVAELENYTRELVSVLQVLLHVSGLSVFQTTSSSLSSPLYPYAPWPAWGINQLNYLTINLHRGRK